MDQHRIIKKLNAPIMLMTVRWSSILFVVVPTFTSLIVSSSMLVAFGVLVFMMILGRILRKLPKYYLIRLIYGLILTKRFNKLFATNFVPSHLTFFLRR